MEIRCTLGSHAVPATHTYETWQGLTVGVCGEHYDLAVTIGAALTEINDAEIASTLELCDECGDYVTQCDGYCTEYDFDPTDGDYNTSDYYDAESDLYDAYGEY